MHRQPVKGGQNGGDVLPLTGSLKNAFCTAVVEMCTGIGHSPSKFCKGHSLFAESCPLFPLPQVDIDIKLRSCKGSCERYSPYQMEVGSYLTLEKQVEPATKCQVRILFPKRNHHVFHHFPAEAARLAVSSERRECQDPVRNEEPTTEG